MRHRPASRRRVLGQATAALALTTRHGLQPQPAQAWCGGYYPGKISNDWDETTVKFEVAEYSTEVFTRVMDPPRRAVYGSSSKGFRTGSSSSLPTILLVGCPGVSYDYLENLEGCALSGRRVISVNTCEAPTDRTSRSWLADAPERGPREMRRPRIAAKQLMAVCAACGVGDVHVFGHGLGGAAALHLAEMIAAATTTNDESSTSATPSSPRLASLTLVSPYGSMEDLRPFAQKRIRGVDDLVPLEFDGSDAEAAIDGQQCVVEASLLTGMPYREALLRASRAEASAERLGDERLASRLPSARVPTLLVYGGSADVVNPNWDLRARQDVKVRDYPFSGHLPFMEQREEFLFDLLDFYDDVDGVKTPRAGLADGRG